MRWPWQRREPKPDPEAARAREDAERRLREVSRQWPEVHRAARTLAGVGDQLAVAIEQSMRRRA